MEENHKQEMNNFSGENLNKKEPRAGTIAGIAAGGITIAALCFFVGTQVAGGNKNNGQMGAPTGMSGQMGMPPGMNGQMGTPPGANGQNGQNSQNGQGGGQDGQINSNGQGGNTQDGQNSSRQPENGAGPNQTGMNRTNSNQPERNGASPNQTGQNGAGAQNGVGTTNGTGDQSERNRNNSQPEMNWRGGQSNSKNTSSPKQNMQN